jgi:hypothetical protein
VALLVVLAGLSGSAAAATLIADFESGTAPGWGALTNSGVLPWSTDIGPANGTVSTGSVGSTSGSKVLDLTGNAAFNFGQSSGAALGFDFLSQNLRQAFLDHNTLEFDWVAPPNGSPSGFSQLFNIILNSQGGGFVNVAGSNAGTPETQQFYFTGYNGVVHHVVVDYTNYKNTILASANPNGGGWLQFGIQPNAGDGAPGQMHFDNFAFTPEPSGLAVVGLGVASALRRRRTA